MSMAAISSIQLPAPDCDAHLIDIGHVLARDVQHGNVEDVEVLLTDQVKQQVQRAFKGFEKDLQRFRRDIQILRQRKQWLAIQACQSNLVDHRRCRVKCVRALARQQCLVFSLAHCLL